MLTKRLLLPAVAIVLLGTATLGIVNAHAQENTSTPFSGLAEAIAQKFNLNQSDVQSVVTDWHTKQHAKMEQQMQQRLSQKLDDAVKEGKLTTAQKQAILDKMSQLQTERQNTDLKSLTEEERRTQMEQKRTELENWAKSQGIDTSLLPMFFRGPGHMRGMGMRVWKTDSLTPTPTQ